MPVVHLWRHAGGKLQWDEAAQAFVPDGKLDWMQAIGAANGCFDIADALLDAQSVTTGTPLEPVLGSAKRQWIDDQHDVTLKDVELAARENSISVEHLKRYTTLGMASGQGKTSNVAGPSAMARLQGKPIPDGWHHNLPPRSLSATHGCRRCTWPDKPRPAAPVRSRPCNVALKSASAIPPEV